MAGFQTFLRGEVGLYYVKKYHPYFCIQDIDALLNFLVKSHTEEEIRSLEYLWKVYTQEEGVDVNEALKRWNTRQNVETSDEQ